MRFEADRDTHSLLPFMFVFLPLICAEHIHKKSGYTAVILGIITVAIGTTLVATVKKHYLPAFIAALGILFVPRRIISQFQHHTE